MAEGTATVQGPQASEEHLLSGDQRTLVGRTLAFVRQYPVGSSTIICVVAVMAIFSGWIAPRDPLRGSLFDRNLPPAWTADGTSEHLLGTDPLGRDLLSRIIHGARISMTIVGAVLLAGGIAGTTIGMASGLMGGLRDDAIMRVVDLTMALPFVLVALAVVIVLGQSFAILVVLLIAFSWGYFARQIRAETLTLKTLDYVSFARIAGASNWRIMFKHILPGVINTAIVIATLRVGTLILTESLLSFLGVGVPAPRPTWGTMVSDGRDYVASAWWISFFPGLAIFMTVAAFNFLGDWFRDHLDPRLRQTT